MSGKVKRVLSLILVLVFALVLAGCGQTPPEDSATSSQSTGVNGTELKPYELKWYMLVPNGTQKDQDEVMEAASKYLKEKINATLKIVFCDWSYGEKMKMVIQSGEQFDLCFSASWMDYTNYVSKGAYLELDGLLDKYAPKTKAQINSAYLKGPRVDGRLYAIPTEKEVAATYGFVMKKELVDKYKFDLNAIKKPEDMEPLFQTIKDKEPGIVPLMKGGNFMSDIIFQRISGGSVGAVYKYKDDTKVYNQFETPEYQEALKRNHEWFKKGYINKDIATMKDNGASYHKSGKFFAEMAQLKPGKADELTLQYGYPMVQVEMCSPFTSTDETTNSMISISRTSKDPERAMMAIELLHTDPYLLNLVKFGLEGKHYTKNGNIIDFPAGINAQSTGYNTGSGWTIGNQFLDYIWSNEDPKKWEKFDAFNKSSKQSNLIGFNFNADTVKNEQAACNAIALQADSKYSPLEAGCSLDPAVTIPKVIAELKKAGADKIIEEKQKQIDAFLASKK